MSILNVHMKHMFHNGRLLVRDAPINSVAADFLGNSEGELVSYEELLVFIAEKCDKMSGASLAAITRAAASRALERAVSEFTDSIDKDRPHRSIVSDCVVTLDDFEQAVHDVLESSREGDTNETAT
jgi:SpoVK/Ycf46/Vps4 family AAA+-type ATPase